MKRDLNIEEERMNEQFGPAISNLLEDSSVRHIWRLSFLVNFFLRPMYCQISERYGVGRFEVQILYSLTQQKNLMAQDISLITGQPKNTVSRAVSTLIKKKYIVRKTRDQDRRAKSLELTKSGRALIAEIIPHVERRQKLARDVLTPDERKKFDELLGKIVFSLPEWLDADL